ncbi:MAG: lamin tail domain-containing protein [Verrucomicrobiota bacterium]|nr:lamin tail domain-containing protein [Verrucomicrobiota bacterium]
MKPFFFRILFTGALSVIIFSFTRVDAALHITEFLANNEDSIQDEDGDNSDWIEIFNSGSDPINLEGYYLTDDSGVLTKWRFPSIEIPSGGFLLVFASEKDRRGVNSELHTNFKLSGKGEYLALVEKNGSTIVSEFGSQDGPFPRQFEDISYGLMQGGGIIPTLFIGPQQQVKVLVPDNDLLGDSWLAIDFGDETWQSAQMGVGYDENTTYANEFGDNGNLGGQLNGVNNSLYIRANFMVDNPASITELILKMKYDDGFVAYLNDTLIADANAPGGLSWNSEATADHSDNEAVVFQEFNVSSFLYLLKEGKNVLAIHGLNGGITSSDMLISAELHGKKITDPSLGKAGYLAMPSPRGYNGETFDGFVGDTQFSVDRGFYEESFNLEITSSTEGAKIRYTLDGTAPSTTNGILYEGPINVDKTTVLRAIAYMSGFRPTNIDTHTYIFPEDVVDQPRMRNSVTQSNTLGPQMIDSLKSVPTISIVTDNPSPFTNESSGNIRSESPASVEMIFSDGSRGFQEDGGLKHFGGYYTNFRKKSFRIGFRSKYGATKVNFPLFDGFNYKYYPPTDRFDIMDLRSGSHDMQSRGAYMSNRFTDDTMLEMGNLAPHGRFVHVYLNGNYWVQYHLRERWNADMASSYLGGPKSDYDAVNLNDGFRADEKVYDGSGELWNDAKQLASGSNAWSFNDNHIDFANLIDFMLLWVSGNSESEVRLLGSKAQGQPFRFQMKDADGFLRSPSHSVNSSGPLNLMSSSLINRNPDYAMLLADRIHMHFFNDGVLTPSRNIARLKKRVDEARLGFIAESARWGNQFREYQSWLDYQNNLINNHFPSLTNTMISKFRSAGMYPDIMAPVFSQHGGSVSPDTKLTMATDSDTIYYTTDGTDPRLPGGDVNPRAKIATFGGGGPVPVTYISSGNPWKYLDNGTDQGDAWREANFDDLAWPSGASELGYGSDGEGAGTRLSFGPSSSSKYPTTYFRTNVVIPDPSIFFNFLLRVKYDDGIAIYINGREVLRQNLDSNASFSSYANSTVSDESGWKEFTLPKTVFSSGSNVIAAEIHQASGSSSDIRFDMFLRGETTLGGGDNVTDPFYLKSPTLLRARSYDGGSNKWSALNEAFFSIDSVPAASTNLVISEINYHPYKPTKVEELEVSSDRDDYEFIEFFNSGNRAIDLTGLRFDLGVNFTFSDNTILASGQYLLLIRNRDAFESRYGARNVQIQEYTGRLSNDGEQLRIVNDDLETIIDFTYNDQLPWPKPADGEGATLSLSGNVISNPSNWSQSRTFGGSPGEAEVVTIPYDEWAAINLVEEGPEGDDDSDGVSNYLEYYFGSDPKLYADAPFASANVQMLGEDNYLTISFPRNTLADASVEVEFSLDLRTWTSESKSFETISNINNGNGVSKVTIRYMKPISNNSKKVFFRLKSN